MPPVTRMTREQVAADLKRRGVDVANFASIRRSRGNGANGDLCLRGWRVKQRPYKPSLDGIIAGLTGRG